MMAGGIAASASAATDVTFSYAYETDGEYGTLKKETYDVAIFLPGETFGGYKIKKIECPLNSSTGYKDGLAWLTKELKLESKKNVADIATWQCEVNGSTVSYTLAAPETVPAEGVYVGVSFTIDKLDAGSKRPVLYGENGDANTLFVHTSKTSPSVWQNLGASDGYAGNMIVTLEVDNLKENNVTVGKLPASVLMELNTPATFEAQLLNTSSNEVSSVDYEYTLNGNTYSSHADFATPVKAGMAVPFYVTVDVPAQAEACREDVPFTVTKVNGVANAASNPTAMIYISVVTEMPVHQALFEEYTGTWCGWCARGYAALEHIKKNYPSFVVAAYHNGDPMTVTNDYPAAFSGYPAASIDRLYIGDPYYGVEGMPGEATFLPVVGNIEYINAQPTTWGVKATATVDGNTVNVKSQVFNIGRVSNCKYKLAYILVSDGLTGSTWAQSNYYSGDNPSAANIPELNNFCKNGIYGSSSVKGLVFDDVVISKEGFKGVAGSMPTELEPEVYYDNTYKFDITGNKLVQDKSKLYVIVSILDEKGYNVNCCKVHVEDAAGVDGIDTDADAPVEYYNLNGVRVANPEKGIFIKKQGSKTSKVAF